MKVLVAVAMATLKELFTNEPILFYELVMLARDPQHKLFGNSGQRLEDRSLLRGGKLDAAMREIIVAATEGDGLDLRMRSPLAV